MVPVDTDDKYLEILRKIPAHKKLKAAFELYELARSRVAGEIRRQNPQMDETELNQLVIERFSSHD